MGRSPYDKTGGAFFPPRIDGGRVGDRRPRGSPLGGSNVLPSPLFRRGRFALSVLVLSLAAGSVAGDASAAPGHSLVPEDYFSLEYPGIPVFSPDGDHVAYVQSGWEGPDGGRRSDLWVMEADGSGARRLSFDLRSPHGVAWGPGSEWIYFGASYDRGEEAPPYDGSSQVWRIRRDGTDLQAVSRVEDGVGLFQLAPDGRALYYTVDDEHIDEAWKDLQQEWKDLEYGTGVTHFQAVHRLDLQSWRDTEVAPADRVLRTLRISPDGRRMAAMTAPDEEIIYDEGQSEIEVLDLQTGEWETVTGHHWRVGQPSPFGWLSDMAWSRDGRALVFDVAYDGYPSEMWVMDWEAGQLWKLERPGEISYSHGLAWRGSRRSVVFVGEDQGRARVYEITDVRAGRQGEMRTLTEGDVVVTSFGFDPRGRQLVVAADRVDRVGEFYAARNGRLHRLSSINEHMEDWILPQIRDFSWKGGNGDEVHGILELPAGHDPATDGPLPTVIELHGGPTSSTKFRFRLWIYGRALMPANGYALLSPNYHGSVGYGDAFLTELVGRENDIEVQDIAAGTEALIDAGIADAGHIGVMGWSNGGFLTNCMIVARPDLYAAASSGAGVLDMVIQWGTEDTPGHVINFIEGLPWEKPEAYRKASPLYGLDRVRTPTLIHVGGSDPRVPPAHSRALFRALHHYLDVPVQLVVYPGEPHGLTTWANRLAKMQWDLAWFAKYLRGEPADTD